MDKEKTIHFIETSFLHDLLFEDGVTDISFNGNDIYYLHNDFGRQKSNITISDEEARDFIRQIANLCEKQFSFQTPELDVSIGRYRINAIHPSIARRDNEPHINFSIRLSSKNPLITKKSTFLNAELISLFDVLLQSSASIVIGGMTGCGKTELQKYLITCMSKNTRVIVIDNILELDNLDIDDLDINIWQADEKNKQSGIQNLVRNALRSNPDWLIVAESRGKEMLDVLNSALTGHPIITTLHAFDINSMPKRMTRMVMMDETRQDYEMVTQDINYSFHYYVYLKREITGDGKVLRYIQEVAEFLDNGIKNTIYLKHGEVIKTGTISKKGLTGLRYKENELFKKFYVKEEEK